MLKIELLHSSVILIALSKHSVLGDVCFLRSRASLEAAKPTSLFRVNFSRDGTLSNQTLKQSSRNLDQPGGNETLFGMLLLSRILLSIVVIAKSAQLQALCGSHCCTSILAVVFFAEN